MKNLNIESLNWDDKTWEENLKGTTLKRIKPWMWKRNIKANMRGKNRNMKKFLKKIVCLSFISFCFLKIEKVQSIVPYYYFPTTKNLKKESLSIGKSAYQLLYFGQVEESLNLAKLAVKINTNNEKLWLILSETQAANKLYKDALNSLNKAQDINSKNNEIYLLK